MNVNFRDNLTAVIEKLHRKKTSVVNNGYVTIELSREKDIKHVHLLSARPSVPLHPLSRTTLEPVLEQLQTSAKLSSLLKKTNASSNDINIYVQKKI